MVFVGEAVPVHSGPQFTGQTDFAEFVLNRFAPLPSQRQVDDEASHGHPLSVAARIPTPRKGPRAVPLRTESVMKSCLFAGPGELPHAGSRAVVFGRWPDRRAPAMWQRLCTAFVAAAQLHLSRVRGRGGVNRLCQGGFASWLAPCGESRSGGNADRRGGWNGPGRRACGGEAHDRLLHL